VVSVKGLLEEGLLIYTRTLKGVSEGGNGRVQ